MILHESILKGLTEIVQYINVVLIKEENKCNF